MGDRKEKKERQKNSEEERIIVRKRGENKNGAVFIN
jgi:hypothetical protein